MKEFLKDLKRMICEEGLEYQAPWSQVPNKYQEEFKAWCAEIKQQSWDDMWERGWDNYCHQFLAYIIDKHIEEGL